MRIPVGPEHGPGRYEVLVGYELGGELPALLHQARRVLVIYPTALAALGERTVAELRAAGFEALGTDVPDGEPAKTAEVLARCWHVLGQAEFTRTDAVVGLGGGAVTDLAGFVAASWLRGVPVVQVPTTLLAMVDAAVGGKTGINTAEGKNLVGAFHPPAGVLCDLSLLRTLPSADLVAGLAEVVKCGFIADPRILQLIESPGPEAVVSWQSPVLRELVERSVAVKARVVTEDLKESALREILNYGHTFGHAIEQVEGYTWRHGHAVSVGMVYAAELGRLAGHTSADLVDRHRALLSGIGLPVRYSGAAARRLGEGAWPALHTAMRRDKKTRGDLLRFVVLDDVAAPTRLVAPDQALLTEAHRLVTA